MPAVRSATVTWTGTLAEGSGTVSAGTSELFVDLPVSWASRTEDPDGRTSPEELLAAAHASCFAMALSIVLAEGCTPPERLEISAVCTHPDHVGHGHAQRLVATLVNAILQRGQRHPRVLQRHPQLDARLL